MHALRFTIFFTLAVLSLGASGECSAKASCQEGDAAGLLHILQRSHGPRAFALVDREIAEALERELRLADTPISGANETTLQNDVEELTNLLKAAKHQDRFGNDVWITPNKPTCNSSQKMVYQPTVPRSGNSWTRLSLEEASGIGTNAVFENEECTLAKKCPCGATNDCKHVHPGSNQEPSLLKMHYPFLDPVVDFHPPIERALLTIRNPFDNFLAWARYRGKHPEAHQFRSFLAKYVGHFAYWFRRAQNECMQITMVRFEDMVEHYEEILEDMKDAMGWTSFYIKRAKDTYPPSKKLIAKHLYQHPALVLDTPFLQQYAQSLTDPEKGLMELLGYGDFIVELGTA